jgi:hypothetical protein
MSTQSKFNALELLSRIRAANATASSESKSYNQPNIMTLSPELSNFQNIVQTASPLKGKSKNTTNANSYQPDDSVKRKGSIRSRGNLSRSIDAFRDIPSPDVTGRFSLDDTRRESSSAKRRESKNKNFENSYQDQVDSYGNAEYSKQMQNVPQHLLQNQNVTVPKNIHQDQNQDQYENESKNQHKNENDYISSPKHSKERLEDSLQQNNQNVVHNSTNVPPHTGLNRSFRDTYDTDDNYGTGEFGNILHSAQNHVFEQNISNYHSNSNSGCYSNNNNLNNHNNSIKKNSNNSNNNNINNNDDVNNYNYNYSDDNGNNMSNNSNNNTSIGSNGKYNNRYAMSPCSDDSFAMINGNRNNLNGSMEIKRNFNSNRDFEYINSAEIVVKNSPFTDELYNELNKLTLENESLKKKNKILQNQKNEIEKVALENKIKNDDIITKLRGE